MINSIHYNSETKLFSAKSNYQQALILKADMRMDIEKWRSEIAYTLGNYFYKSKEKYIDFNGETSLQGFVSNMSLVGLDIDEHKKLGSVVYAWMEEKKPKYFKGFKSLGIIINPLTGNIESYLMAIESVKGKTQYGLSVIKSIMKSIKLHNI